MLEIAWTVIPVLILVVIAIPSFRLIYYEDRARDADLTIKVPGHQWYWHYTYPDNGNIDFDSYIVPDDQLKPGQLPAARCGQPAGRPGRQEHPRADHRHGRDPQLLRALRSACSATPFPGGRIETWFRADQPGTFYGQCNQICGTNH